MPIKNFWEKGAWAYPGTAQIFWVPPIISGTGKAIRTSNFVGTFIESIGTKAHENVWNSGRGRSQAVSKIFRAPICRAHCAVIFAIAQLSCYFWTPQYSVDLDSTSRNGLECVFERLGIISVSVSYVSIQNFKVQICNLAKFAKSYFDQQWWTTDNASKWTHYDNTCILQPMKVQISNRPDY